MVQPKTQSDTPAARSASNAAQEAGRGEGSGGLSAVVLPGIGASSGAAAGPAILNLAQLDELSGESLGEDEVQSELARLDSVARAARVSLVKQREALSDHFTEEQRRVFDTHLRMLEDPTIEADVRERIEQGMSLEGAVLDALHVYERLFEVVESEKLRNRVSDMRDVALRLLRYCKRPASRAGEEDMRGGVLIVRELSLSDLTEALEHGALGIVAEAGKLDTHGAILTRAAGLPAVIGVGDLREKLQSGDRILVDADLGQVILNPPEDQVSAILERRTEGEDARPIEPVRLSDGTELEFLSAVASPAEARRAAAMGVLRVGLYRTDLPVLQRHGKPREEPLTQLYRQVVSAVDDVCWRLPDLDSSTGIGGIYADPEPNPALGLRGCRLLLDRPQMLRTQLRSIMRASEGRPVCIAVPFVNDVADLRSMREALDNAREELRLEGLKTSHPVQLGAVIETPSSALMVREILGASDFGLVGIDNLAMYLLVADRLNDHGLVGGRHDDPHPAVLRAVRKVCQVADGLGKRLVFYGESIGRGAMLPLLIGVGAETFALRSTMLRDLPPRLATIDHDTCVRIAEAACHASTAAELLDLLPASWR